MDVGLALIEVEILVRTFAKLQPRGILALFLPTSLPQGMYWVVSLSLSPSLISPYQHPLPVTLAVTFLEGLR